MAKNGEKWLKLVNNCNKWQRWMRKSGSKLVDRERWTECDKVKTDSTCLEWLLDTKVKILVIFRQKRPILGLEMQSTQLWWHLAVKYDFSVLIRQRTFVKEVLRLLHTDFKRNLWKGPNADQENTQSPHGCWFTASPKILIFFENLIELKF